MSVGYYYEKIRDCLQEQNSETQAARNNRHDWSGSGLVLEIYDRSAGKKRDEIIRAMGQIIEEGTEPPSVIAQVLHIVSSLEITQVEPSVLELSSKEVALSEPIQSAISNYFAFRELHLRRSEELDEVAS